MVVIGDEREAEPGILRHLRMADEVRSRLFLARQLVAEGDHCVSSRPAIADFSMRGVRSNECAVEGGRPDRWC